MIIGAYRIIKKEESIDIMFLLRFLIYLFIFYIDYILKLYYLLGGFAIMTDIYIDVYSFKFNSIKETLKNLSINFYGFLITTSLLFVFKFYLLLSDIKTPSFYYLFLTIPISGAVVYFYTKDLAPILKEAKNKQK
jgi:hypothetical protein